MRSFLRKPEAPVLTERERTLDLLGMARLREVEEARGRVTLALASHEELSDAKDTPWQYSLDMWRRFLPKSRLLSEYTFDAPPRDVLAELEQVTLFKIYDRIEVWTPKNRTTPSDRMVVGVIAEQAGVDRYFRIAHWGSPHTSPAAVRASLQQIERLKKREKLWKKYKPAVFIASAVVVLGLFGGGLFAVSSSIIESAPPPSPAVEEAPAPPVEEPPSVQDDEESSSADSLPPTSESILGGVLSLIVPLFFILVLIALACAGLHYGIRFIAVLMKGSRY